MSKKTQRAAFMSTPILTGEQTTPLRPLKSYLDPKSRSGESTSMNRRKISDLFSSSRLLNCIKNRVRRTFGALLLRKRESRPETSAHSHFVPPRDSHHSEAMEDCIDFINSSYRKSLSA